MNRDQISQLSFDCVLPASIFFNENLEPNCIKLYAMVRNLSKMHGYCFATNEYLAKLLKSDISSIKRWLLSLKKEGYLDLQTNKTGIHWSREIYLSDDFKKCLRRFKNEPPPAQNCAPPSSEMSHIKDLYSKEEYSSSSPLSKKSPKTPEGLEEWMKRMTSLGWKEEECKLAWNRYLQQPSGSIKNPKKWLETVLQSIRDSGAKEDHLKASKLQSDDSKGREEKLTKEKEELQKKVVERRVVSNKLLAKQYEGRSWIQLKEKYVVLTWSVGGNNNSMTLSYEDETFPVFIKNVLSYNLSDDRLS